MPEIHEMLPATPTTLTADQIADRHTLLNLIPRCDNENFSTAWAAMAPDRQLRYLAMFMDTYGRRPHVDPSMKVFKAVVAAMHKRTTWFTQHPGDTYFGRRNGYVGDGSDHFYERVAKVREWLDARCGFEHCPNCGGRLDTCGCMRCGNCERVMESTCAHCESCHDCCECQICEHCHELQENCGCAPLRLTHQRNKAPPTFFGEPTATYPRHIGVEIEFGTSSVAGASMLNEASDTWRLNIHDDGSIEDFDNTVEVSTSPAQGNAFVEQITDVCAGIRQLDGEVNSSCGLHVHVSVKDLDSAQLLAFLVLYSKVEAGLYSIVAPSRWRSIFAIPWQSSFEMARVFDHKSSIDARMARLETLLYGAAESIQAVKDKPYKHGVRYHGLNLNAILLYGTVEFRMHQGSVNLTKIMNWAAVCSALVEHAKTHTEKQIRSMSGSAFEVLCKVVKNPVVRKWMRTRRDWFACKQLKALSLETGEVRGAQVEESEQVLNLGEFQAHSR